MRAPRCDARPHAGALREGDALRYRGPREALTPDLLARLKAHKPAILAAVAHPDLPGVSPEFAARLSPEDLEDIAAGDIALGTVQGFEKAAVTKEGEDLREAFEGRAGILEHDVAPDSRDTRGGRGAVETKRKGGGGSRCLGSGDEGCRGNR